MYEQKEKKSPPKKKSIKGKAGSGSRSESALKGKAGSGSGFALK
jgi:hypothetical protein